MAANPYAIDYNDEKFRQVETEKKDALSQVDQTYNNMINQSDSFYQAQIDASNEWGKQQQQLQQQQTDFMVEQINQQKDQANKDYKKEQSGAYVDWQKQSNQFGANAEQQAAQGLANTGFSESSQVSMYNTYQNRIAMSRESFNQVVLAYNNNIKEAQLANNAKLAEIAFQTLQKGLELNLAGFQYKNQLLIDQTNKKLEVDQIYHNRYLDVLNQMNQENALAEEVRQHNESLAEEQRQYNQTFAEEQRQYNESLKMQQKQLQEEIRQYNQSYSLQVKEYNEGIRQFDAEIARLKAKDAKEYKIEIQQLELQKQQLAQQKANADREYKLKQQQLAEEQRQFNASLAASKAKSSSGGSGGSSGSVSIGGGGSSKSAVVTDYYKGSLNPDTKYGTFNTKDKNGVKYQPNNVGGKKLSKAGLTIENNGVTQNVWKSSDGKYYYWEGRQNKYIQMNSGYVKALLKVANTAKAFK